MHCLGPLALHFIAESLSRGKMEIEMNAVDRESNFPPYEISMHTFTFGRDARGQTGPSSFTGAATANNKLQYIKGLDGRTA